MPFFAHSDKMLEIYNDLLHGCYIANEPAQFILKSPNFLIHLTDRDGILDHTRITEYRLHLTKVRKLALKGYEGRTLQSFLLFKTMRYNSEKRVLVLDLDPSVEMEFEVELLSAELDQL